MSTGTEWVVWCETHRHYLKHVSVTGTTWREDQTEARRYPTQPAARDAAKRATWIDHRPIVWPLPVDDDLPLVLGQFDDHEDGCAFVEQPGADCTCGEPRVPAL